MGITEMTTCVSHMVEDFLGRHPVLALLDKNATTGCNGAYLIEPLGWGTTAHIQIAWHWQQFCCGKKLPLRVLSARKGEDIVRELRAIVYRVMKKIRDEFVFSDWGLLQTAAGANQADYGSHSHTDLRNAPRHQHTPTRATYQAGDQRGLLDAIYQATRSSQQCFGIASHSVWSLLVGDQPVAFASCYGVVIRRGPPGMPTGSLVILPEHGPRMNFLTHDKWVTLEIDNDLDNRSKAIQAAAYGTWIFGSPGDYCYITPAKTSDPHGGFSQKLVAGPDSTLGAPGPYT